MALAPPPASPAAGMAGGPAPGAIGGDAMAGAADGAGAGETVLVTICKAADGSYTVYDGDEAESGGGSDMSEDDAAAMGPAGDLPAPAPGGSPEGQPADSIGAALKIAMDILQAERSSEGAPGNADDQFAAGFGASKTPTPATGLSSRS